MLLALLLALLVYGYYGATRPPRVVTYAVSASGWRGPPLRIALLSDTHVVLPDMPPARLAAVCDQATALGPDIILLAGDYVSGRLVASRKPGPREATAPFARCRARLGVFAVLGNHDMRPPMRADDVAAGLRGAGVRVLRNDAARVGDLWLAGVDDWDFGHADVNLALARVPVGAPTLFLMHSPDIFSAVPPWVALSVAGHTHGGQVAPFGPVLLPVARRDWARGLVRDRGAAMVVTSGIGASIWPARIGVPPEIVVITLSGADHSVGRKSGTLR